MIVELFFYLAVTNGDPQAENILLILELQLKHNTSF